MRPPRCRRTRPTRRSRTIGVQLRSMLACSRAAMGRICYRDGQKGYNISFVWFLVCRNRIGTSLVLATHNTISIIDTPWCLYMVERVPNHKRTYPLSAWDAEYIFNGQFYSSHPKQMLKNSNRNLQRTAEFLCYLSQRYFYVALWFHNLGELLNW